MLAAASELGLAYLETYTSYDLANLMAHIQPSHRVEQEGQLRDKIRFLKLFRVKLSISVDPKQESAGPQEAQMYMTLRETLGSLRP